MTKEELKCKQQIKITLPDNPSGTRVFWNSFIANAGVRSDERLFLYALGAEVTLGCFLYSSEL